MRETILGYLIFGVMWGAWLEYYTTQNILGPMGRPWIWRERIFHTFLWPISLGVFIYEFIRGLLK